MASDRCTHSGLIRPPIRTFKHFPKTANSVDTLMVRPLKSSDSSRWGTIAYPLGCFHLEHPLGGTGRTVPTLPVRFPGRSRLPASSQAPVFAEGNASGRWCTHRGKRPQAESLERF